MMQEQEIVAAIQRAAEPLRSVAAAHRAGTGLQSFTDSAITSVASFMVSDVLAAQVERFQVLNLVTARTQLAQALVEGDPNNTKGLDSLSSARNALGQLRQEVGEYPPTADIGGDVDTFQKELREALAATNFRVTDIQKVDSAAQGAFDAVRGGSPIAFVDYLDEQVGRLDGLRHQADLGRAENIAEWIIAAICIFLGISLWSVCWCAWWGECWLRDNLPWDLVWLILRCIFFGGCF